MITIDFVYDPRYTGRYENFFRIKDKLADLSVVMLENKGDTRSDIAIVQSHLIDQLRGHKDPRVLRPMIVNERADQETVAVGNRMLLKERNTIAWLKECTIRDSTLHNAPHVAGYYHYGLLRRDLEKFPALEPEIKLDASDIAKIRLPFSVASFSRFDNVRARACAEPKDRDVDVFTWGTIHSSQDLYWQHRASACRAVADLAAANPRYNTVLAVGRGLADAEVRDLLFRSKIVVSQYGHSMSSYKDWEALYAGCVLIRPDASLQVNYLPDIFKENEWYVPCAPDFSDLKEKVELVLQDFPRYFARAQIARSALIEANDPERRASDFYHMICDIVQQAPSQNARPFTPIEPSTYRQAKPEHLQGSGPSIRNESSFYPGVGIAMQHTNARALRGPNLFGKDVELGAGLWAIVRSRLDARPVDGPGGMVGAKLIEDNSLNTHDFRRAVTKEAKREPYVFSLVARAQERSRIQVWMGAATQADRAQVSFDLLEGRGTNATVQGTGWTNLSAGVTSLEGAWYWCWMAVLTDDSTTLAVQVALESSEGNIGYTGDGASGACFGNLRLEQGNVPTLVLPVVAGASWPSKAPPHQRGTEDGEKVAFEIGEYYDRYFNKVRPREIAGFHGDYYLMRYMFNLLRQADVFVETGSLSGDTVIGVARNFLEMNCYTCELDSRNFDITSRRTKSYLNIEASNEPSPDFLHALYARVPRLKNDRVVFWLDAHSKGALPLPAEVEKITESGAEFCIAIDDFQVPGRPYFAFDSYPPIKLNWELIQPCLKAGRKYKIIYPKYEAHTSLHAPRVGWIVIAAGNWELVPEGLDELYEIFEYEALSSKVAE